MMMTNIKITKDTSERLEFTLSQSEIGFANLLRRTIISNIPIFAIDFISVKHNTIFKSETLAHKIGLIPVCTDLILPIKCTECSAFCSKCSYKLELNIKNDENKILKVYSDSFTCDKNIKLLPNMPVIKLQKENLLKLMLI